MPTRDTPAADAKLVEHMLARQCVVLLHRIAASVESAHSKYKHKIHKRSSEVIAADGANGFVKLLLW
jgi:hypothetical protein